MSTDSVLAKQYVDLLLEERRLISSIEIFQSKREKLAYQLNDAHTKLTQIVDDARTTRVFETTAGVLLIEKGKNVTDIRLLEPENKPQETAEEPPPCGVDPMSCNKDGI